MASSSADPSFKEKGHASIFGAFEQLTPSVSIEKELNQFEGGEEGDASIKASRKVKSQSESHTLRPPPSPMKTLDVSPPAPLKSVDAYRRSFSRQETDRVSNLGSSNDDPLSADLNAKVNETSIGSTTSVGSADGSLASEISTLLRRSKDGGGVKCYNGENRKDYTALDVTPQPDPIPPEPPIGSATSQSPISKNLREALLQLKFLPRLLLSSLLLTVIALVNILGISSAMVSATSSSPPLNVWMDYFTLSSIPPCLVITYALNHVHKGAHPCVDVFVAPFLASLLRAIAPSSSSVDYTDAVASLILTATVSNLLAALIVRLAKKIKILRMGYYIPYPVVAGLLASVGVYFMRYAIMLEFSGSTVSHLMERMDMVEGMRLAILLTSGILMWLGGKLGKRESTPVVIALVVMVANLLRWAGVVKDEHGVFWTHHQLPPDTSLQITPLTFYETIFSGSINFDAVYDGVWDVGVMTVMMVIRQSIHFSAVENAIGSLPTSYLESKWVQSPKPKSRPISRYSPPIISPPTTTTFNYKLPISSIINGYSLANLISSITGGVYVIENAGAIGMFYSTGSTGRSEMLLSLAILIALSLASWSPLLHIPIAAFSSVLVLLSIQSMEIFVFRPFFEITSRTEWFIIPAFTSLALFVPVLPCVALGAAVSVGILVSSLTKEGCVRSIGNGMSLRSSIEYYRREEKWLEEEGDRIQVLSLQSYLFFASSPSLLPYVESMFKDLPKNLPYPLEFAPPKPDVLVVDFTNVVGMDYSAKQGIKDIKMLCEINNCQLLLCGPSNGVKRALGGKEEGWEIMATLDDALGAAEDKVLGIIGKVRELEAMTMKRRKQDKEDGAGFSFALALVDEQNGTDYSEILEGAFRGYVRPLELKKGENIYDKARMLWEGGGDVERGLFFIEYGQLSCIRDPYQSTRSSSLRRRSTASGHGGGGVMNNNSVGALDARGETAMRRRGEWINRGEKETLTFRLARLGPGWVVGAREVACGLKFTGTYEAMSDTRLFYLRKSDIDRVAEDKGDVGVAVWKMIGKLVARNLDSAIDQLSNIYTYQGSNRQPGVTDRVTHGKVNHAMSKIQVL